MVVVWGVVWGRHDMRVCVGHVRNRKFLTWFECSPEWEWVIILSSNVMRRVIPDIACPGHNLDVSTSVIVALEICLCLKSYLIGSRIWASQIGLSMHQISGGGARNRVRRLTIYGTFGVICQGWAESSDARSKSGRRHLWCSMWGKQWKLLEGFVFDLSLLIQLRRSNMCSSRLDPDPIGSCRTPTPYHCPTPDCECHQRNSMVRWTHFCFLLFYPTSFPNSSSFVLDSLLFGLPIFLMSLLLLIIALY